MLILYAAAGGAIGSALRYLTTVKIAQLMGIAFPYGTMFVNIFGSLIMGLLIGILTKTMPHSNEMRVFLAVGILGGFTTFSAFSLDVINLIENGNNAQAAVYAVCSVVLSIAAVFFGLFLAR